MGVCGGQFAANSFRKTTMEPICFVANWTRNILAEVLNWTHMTRKMMIKVLFRWIRSWLEDVMKEIGVCRDALINATFVILVATVKKNHALQGKVIGWKSNVMDEHHWHLSIHAKVSASCRCIKITCFFSVMNWMININFRFL